MNCLVYSLHLDRALHYREKRASPSQSLPPPSLPHYSSDTVPLTVERRVRRRTTDAAMIELRDDDVQRGRTSLHT